MDVSYQAAMNQLQSESPRSGSTCACARCTHRRREAEQMVDPAAVRDVVETAWDVYEGWENLPETTKQAMSSTARALWPALKAGQFRKLLATAFALFAPARFRQLAAAARPGYLAGLVRQAGTNIGLPAPRGKRPVTHPPGMSDVQVRANTARQRARGRVPGRAAQGARGGARRQRESEAQGEWEISESNSRTPYGLPRR
jgi:hypothetical protein